MTDPETVETISIDELASRQGEPVPLIDVREPDEYAAGHVPGAVLIPLGQLARRLSEVPRAGTVYVICRSGRRSLDGARTLSRHGLDAVSVDEGTLGWIDRGFDVATGLTER